MSGKVYGLSKKAMTEKYEDLVFTKLMSVYAEDESARILEEIENQNETADESGIKKIFDREERKENLAVLWKYSKKVINFAAMVVFVAIVSLSSVVVASAEAREAVAEAIYHLVLRETDRYTEVSIGNSSGFIDPEIYTWDNAYGITYVPEGFNLSGVYKYPGQSIIDYSKENEYFSFLQAQEASADVDTENAQIVERIVINNSEGLLVVKNGLTQVVWSEGNIYMTIIGTAPTEEIIKVAESIKPIGYFENEEPEEEYTFVDPEIYDWEGAYAPTYMPEGFVFENKKDLINQKIISYVSTDGKERINIMQAVGVGSSFVDTEDAEITKTIKINDSEAFYNKEDGLTTIIWNCGDTFLKVTGYNISGEELIKVAESIKPINKTEDPEPKEEYTFVDPEIYTWDNAYGMTYVPENFIFINSDDLGSSQFLNYRNGEKVLSFIQSTDTSSFVDSENADSIKNIIIGTSEALLITKSDWSCISWTLGNKLLQLSGNVSTEEIIRIAEGVKPIN